jgi:hypothetical protein
LPFGSHGAGILEPLAQLQALRCGRRDDAHAIFILAHVEKMLTLFHRRGLKEGGNQRTQVGLVGGSKLADDLMDVYGSAGSNLRGEISFRFAGSHHTDQLIFFKHAHRQHPALSWPNVITKPA